MKKRKNILMSMSGQEKKFIRRIGLVLKAEGIKKCEMPEQKIEALEAFRIKRNRKCAKIVHDLIEVETKLE